MSTIPPLQALRVPPDGLLVRPALGSGPWHLVWFEVGARKRALPASLAASTQDVPAAQTRGELSLGAGQTRKPTHLRAHAPRRLVAEARGLGSTQMVGLWCPGPAPEANAVSSPFFLLWRVLRPPLSTARAGPTQLPAEMDMLRYLQALGAHHRGCRLQNRAQLDSPPPAEWAWHCLFGVPSTARHLGSHGVQSTCADVQALVFGQFIQTGVLGLSGNLSGAPGRQFFLQGLILKWWKFRLGAELVFRLQLLGLYTWTLTLQDGQVPVRALSAGSHRRSTGHLRWRGPSTCLHIRIRGL